MREAPGGRQRRRAPRPVVPELEENPEATLDGGAPRAVGVSARRARVSVATMSRAIRRLGWTYNEQRRWEPPSRTRGPARRLARAGSGYHDPERLVFVDEECGSNAVGLAPLLCARAPREASGRWARRRATLRQEHPALLAPALRPGQIVVVLEDNL